jgi:uncharacterized repeat protein (TIGR03803 family)
MTKLDAWKMAGAVLLLCAGAVSASPAQTFKTLAHFGGTKGAYPRGPLVQGVNGNLYGTTEHGGAHGNQVGTGGTVFEVTPGGKLTSLYSFCSQHKCTDGELPDAGVVQATNGNFYGTTLDGGANRNDCGAGCGTVFEITPAGKLTTLYSFCSQLNCTDGAGPSAYAADQRWSNGAVGDARL